MDEAARAIAFDANEMLEEARTNAGLSNFGSNSFREPLEALVRTYDANHTTLKGRKKAYRRVIGLLATRLRIEEALRVHPEIKQRPVRSPMVLTGMPRSGTSALFNLLGADPDARPLLLWETQFPDPVEGLEPGAKDPRHAAIEAYYEQSRETNPEFTKIHFASADTPEECVLLHAFTLNGVHHGTEVMLEPYASWYRDQDLGEMYSYYKILLQMLDWQRPGERWLLKAPAHMWAIDKLIDTFPDVSVVWSHRNPLACTASICSMTHLLMEDQVDMPKEVLGPIVMDFYATSLERGLAVRDQSDPARFIDVNHDDFVGDSLGTVGRIYEHFGLPIGDDAAASLKAHIEANPKGRHGKHEYNLDDWGLTADDVAKRFEPYVERFEIEMG
ncbi:MAG TPA: sulfotransferase [Myxococcales bacterium]|nr:sulfotransferase [Myxococcales bacterium]